MKPPYLNITSVGFERTQIGALKRSLVSQGNCADEKYGERLVLPKKT
jgi:hypothetical protein